MDGGIAPFAAMAEVHLEGVSPALAEDMHAEDPAAVSIAKAIEDGKLEFSVTGEDVDRAREDWGCVEVGGRQRDEEEQRRGVDDDHQQLGLGRTVPPTCCTTNNSSLYMKM